MPPNIRLPNISRNILPEPLTQPTFAPFGTVISNPANSCGADPPNHRGIAANQGTALKFPDVTQLTNTYHLAPSHKPAQTTISLFACQPRQLRRAGCIEATVSSKAPAAVEVGAQQRDGLDVGMEKLRLDIRVLEQHPYTSQTFVPMGLAAADESTCYLVIVAMELPASEQDWTGYPDLSSLRAFVARGHQAVTYAAGTWHAPMIVLGSSPVDFVVVQWANGVPEEDCQEVYLEDKDSPDHGLAVAFDLPRQTSCGSAAAHGDTAKL